MKELRFLVTALLRIGIVFMAAVSEAVSRKSADIRMRIGCELYKRGIGVKAENYDCTSLNELPHTN